MRLLPAGGTGMVNRLLLLQAAAKAMKIIAVSHCLIVDEFFINPIAKIGKVLFSVKPGG